MPYQGVKKKEKAQKKKSKKEKSENKDKTTRKPEKQAQLQVETKKRVRVSEDESGSLSQSDDVNVDIDSCSENECESEKEGVAVEIISLSSIVSDAEFKKRVTSCPMFNKENSFPGRKLAKFFEQGWCVGEIVCFRPKRVRSNVTLAASNKVPAHTPPPPRYKNFTMRIWRSTKTNGVMMDYLHHCDE